MPLPSSDSESNEDDDASSDSEDEEQPRQPLLALKLPKKYIRCAKKRCVEELEQS